jgi:hypothetical protein
MAKHHRQELAASARNILSQTTLADYLASRPPSHVVTLDSATATVGSALEALSRASILSAPLTGPEGEVLGFLSVGDCVSAFLAGMTANDVIWACLVTQHRTTARQGSTPPASPKTSWLPQAPSSARRPRGW